MFMKLKEDLQREWLQKELRQYKGCFQELSTQQVVLRGDRIVIPNSLSRGVLDAAHLGHPGKERMT